MNNRGFIFYSFIVIIIIAMTGLTVTGNKDNLKLFAGGSIQGDAKGLFLYDFSLSDGSLVLISENDAGPRSIVLLFFEKV